MTWNHFYAFNVKAQIVKCAKYIFLQIQIENAFIYFFIWLA